MSQLENFKFSRWFNTGHSIFQFVLVITFFVGLNTLALIHYKRFDITEDRKFALSPESISYVQEIDEPIRIIVTQSTDDANSDLGSYYTDVKNLVKEYEYAAQINNSGPIQSEFINVFEQRRRMQELVDEFGIGQPNMVIFASENKHRLVTPDELYVSEGLERKAFRGEQMFTSALLDVASSNGNSIYFLRGHGERDVLSVDPITGISNLAEQLRQRNFEIKALDLTELDSRIPEDADLIVLAGPQQPLLAREVNILKDYLNDNAGRLIILIDPAVNSNLGDLFFQWGVLAEDMVVWDAGTDYLMSGGDLILRRFDPEHPITETFARNSLSVLVGLARPVRVDMGAPLDDRLSVKPIVGGSETSWGERFYRNKEQFGFHENVDLPGPVSVVVVSERSISSDLGIDIPGGRLVVFGTSDLITNSRLTASANLTLFLNTVNWSLDRNNLLSISPKPIEKLHITLSQEEMNKLSMALLLILPGCTALLGLIIYWLRRH